MNFHKTVCQSCGSALLKAADQGSEVSGVPSQAYCRRCYLWGKFTQPAMTVEAMREDVRRRMIDRKLPRFLAALLADRIYRLKRWTVPVP